MKFTVNWLKKYVDFSISANELAEQLTMLGLEVDTVAILYPGLEKIKVAKILDIAKHPNADKLNICNVLVGDDTKRIVCGATNARVGMLAPIALPGCLLPSGQLINEYKIRGEVSEGILCSGQELGIPFENLGLMDLPESCKCGTSLVDALALNDTLIEVDITPNRADCTSLIGIAREVAGVTGGVLKLPDQFNLTLPIQSSNIAVEIIAPHSCPRYAARLLKNVQIGPSPLWIKRLLVAVGIRPINNVVDITNFVMHEYGQPLHAFDFANIYGKKIIIRDAYPGETITTLDGIKRLLDTDMLLICDAKKPIAIAGVMGGKNSEVTDQSTDILLESAFFIPTCIRRSSRTLKLSTDASYRFERGVDPKGTILALERATQLLIEYCGAILVEDGAIDCNFSIAELPSIDLRISRTCFCLGISLNAEEITSLLKSIGLTVKPFDFDTLHVTVPSFRVDLEREIDLIEEVARLYGYNKISPTLPVVPMSLSELEPSLMLRRKLAKTLVSLGVFETINYSFTSERYCNLLGLSLNDPLRNQIKILNPLSDDQGVLRTMLLPGLLENIKHNLNRQMNDLSFFEIGKVFWPIIDLEQPCEAMHLSAVFSGRPGVGSPVLHYGSRSFDMYDLKGIIEILLSQIAINTAVFVANATPPCYADQNMWLTVRLNEREIGSFGKLAHSTLKNFGIKQAVYFADFDLDLLSKYNPIRNAVKSLSKFPSVSRDLAVIVPDSVDAGSIVEVILSSAFPLIYNIEIFDVYHGQPISDGMKSIALSITYHSDNHTLDDKTVGHIHGEVVALICDHFKGQLRDV